MTDDAKSEPTAEALPEILNEDLKRDDLARDEAWRLLIAVVKSAGGRVSVSRELLLSIDVTKESLSIHGPAGNGELVIQVGNGLRG